jgi:hypothetical protein
MILFAGTLGKPVKSSAQLIFICRCYLANLPQYEDEFAAPMFQGRQNPNLGLREWGYVRSDPRFAALVNKVGLPK